MTFSELLLVEFDEEMKKTRKILECVPEGRFAWKPHEKSMPLGRLAGHVAELPGRAASIVRQETLVRMPGYVPFSATTREDLMEKFESESADGRSAIQELREDQLAAVWTVKFGDTVYLQLPRSSALRAICMNHLVHHRAQLGVYLRLLDIPVPGIYGPSADDRLQA
jgi:uncharacterized damage-inducible protein DinB